jgi:hypothetical protein
MSMPMPTLDEGHKLLEKFVGNWAGEEKIYPSPWDREGGTAIARIQNNLILHGFAVSQDYEQERLGSVDMRGHGVIIWNRDEKNYEFHWFNSMGTPPTVFRGQYEAGVFMLASMAPFPSRCIFDFRDPENYIFQIDISQDGSEWSPFMKGTYKRQGVTV